MATLKEIKTRISAVQNTKKITRTMEMVATAKSKRTVDRVNQSIVYSRKLKEMTLNVASASAGIEEPLLRLNDSSKRVGALVITSNRGLCGGFNNNVIKLAQQRILEFGSQGVACDILLIGKKAVNAFNFSGIGFTKSFINIEDKPSYEKSQEITNYFIREFVDIRIDKFEIISTKYMSSTSQCAEITSLLPFHIENTSTQKPDHARSEDKPANNFLFEPSAGQILSSLLPRSVRMSVFQALLESAASEQIARRIAMKNATENASEIIRDLTLVYNRARQAKITQEIAEVVGGATAIN